MKILTIIRHPNNFLLIDSLLKHGAHVDIIFPDKIQFFDIINQKIQSYKNYYITDQFRDFMDEMCSKNNYDLIFPSLTDWGELHLVCELNEKYNMPGLRLKTYDRVRNKKSYYEIWKNLEIPCPKIYDLVEPYLTYKKVHPDVNFPCIVKPSRGAGSIGIQIIENESSLIDFFADTDTIIHRHQEKNGIRYKKMQYFCCGSEYLIQQYIQGSVVSFIGHVYENKINIDCIFDISSSSYPYAAETDITYPSKFDTRKILDKTIIHLEKFFKEIKINNTSFMLDLMVDNLGNVFFIDFSPRLSVSHTMLWYGGETDYAWKLANKLINGKDFETTADKFVAYKALPFEKKSVKNISYNKELADEISIPGKKIQILRNDLAVTNNGYVIFSATSKASLEEKIKLFFDDFKVEYSDI